jgi:hypothetical protein
MFGAITVPMAAGNYRQHKVISGNELQPDSRITSVEVEMTNVNSKRVTMKTVIDNARKEAADNSWQRAQQASRMRKLLSQRGRFGQASICSSIKKQAIRQVLQITPENIEVGIDDDYQVGLLRIRYKDGSMLHLPTDTDLGNEGSDGDAA